MGRYGERKREQWRDRAREGDRELERGERRETTVQCCPFVFLILAGDQLAGRQVYDGTRR